MNSGSLRLRLFAAAAASIGLALFLTGFAIVQLFERQVRERVTVDLGNDLLQLAGAIEVAPDGTVKVARALADPRFIEPYGGRYWRIDFAPPGMPAPREPLRSRSLWDADLDRANPVGPEGEKLIVASRQISVGASGKEVGLWLLAAAHEDEVQRPTGQLRDQLTLSLTLMGVVLLIGAWIQVTVGLSPLKTLRWQLADVRSGLADRLTGRFPSEVAPLAGELNDVLEMREKSLDRARRRAGDLAHGLKTPLTVLSSISRELRRRNLDKQADDIDEQAEAMRRHVEQALARARLSSGRSHSTTLLWPAVEKVKAALQRLPGGEDIRWEIRIAATAAVPLEAGDLTELLGNLMDNARKWAKARARIAYSEACLSIEDDGPGVPEAELGRIAERGRRLDESQQGSGLGLSIVADIADIYGFTIDYGASELGGLKVTVRL
ncbi:MAG: HAMP domain-containing histidine kinase [Rhizobiales bacterium]|nr:HAMP domain-containing histidine kinase [Hyphomicrobiales bacterium]MBI3673425.1 HAMP domain-containing histidine kinase [Hyphomicrobiales bacterium]